MPVGSDGDEAATRLLIFDENGALTTEGTLPCYAYGLQLVPLDDGRVCLLAQDAALVWHGYILNPADGAVVPTGFTLPADPNRETALLAADEAQNLVALSGMSTRLLLTRGTETLLTAEIPGSLIYAESDGATARLLLLLQNGQLRLETWRLNLP